MVKNIVTKILEVVLGNRISTAVLHAIWGNAWRGYLLPIIRYRGPLMCTKGETVVLAGIFSPRTVLNFRDAVGPSGKVCVIEANPETAEKLQHAFREFSNVSIVSQALWNERGETTFVASKTNMHGFDRIIDNDIQPFPHKLVVDSKKMTIRTDSLDNILRGLSINRIDHVNLTINGAELQALDGMKNTFKQNPCLRMYINTQYPYPSDLVLAKLQNTGFRFFTAPVKNLINEDIQLLRVYAYRK